MEQESKIAALQKTLQNSGSHQERENILDKHPEVVAFFKTKCGTDTILSELSLEERYAFKLIIALEQDFLFSALGQDKEALKALLKVVLETDQFYGEIGGIVGYQKELLKLLKGPKAAKKDNVTYCSPPFIDISSDEDDNVRNMILDGIRGQEILSEIYPIGGAADRLHLKDEATGEPLPAAKLLFGGKNLLQLLLQDLQGREFLHYKLFGKKLVTPVALMTSKIKDNHQHVLRICEEAEWFGRPKDSFRVFIQPSVPTVDEEGRWCAMQNPFRLFLKPGGHGIIWKLAKENGVLEWLKGNKRKKAIVRQINNPMAGTDYGLLAFAGFGTLHNMNFGFASCPREVGTAEGVNVLVEKRQDDGHFEYTLSNLEYCNFEHYGIVDAPQRKGGKYSKFSSNTNILFVDITAIEEAVTKNPFPGTLVNLKTVNLGEAGTKKAARLESTMQNISDVLVEKSEEPLRHMQKAYITYNKRRKTISVVKKVYFPSSCALETPEQCFYDHMQNQGELLNKYCEVITPKNPSFENYMKKGPAFIFLFHPALGPLYSIIAQKIHKGRLAKGSELRCEIAELELADFALSGSLIIRAENVIGAKDESGIIDLGKNLGRCTLRNVTIVNKGIDYQQSGTFWKDELKRKESLHIVLKGNSEFFAENITLKGNFYFEVEDGYRLHLFEKDGKLVAHHEPISRGILWKYNVTADAKIVLYKEK